MAQLVVGLAGRYVGQATVGEPDPPSPTIPIDYPQPDRRLWSFECQDFQSTNIYPLFGILDVPFVPIEYPQPDRAKWDYGQQIEQQPNQFAFYDLLEAPFVPKEFWQAERRIQEQSDVGSGFYYLGAVEVPFFSSEHIQYQRAFLIQDDQLTNLLPLQDDPKTLMAQIVL